MIAWFRAPTTRQEQSLRKGPIEHLLSPRATLASSM
jgi:hypothetical protein